MTVAELITLLQTMPQELHLVVPLYSEQHLLEVGDVRAMFACEARQDGWVENRRKDKPQVQYLCIG